MYHIIDSFEHTPRRAYVAHFPQLFCGPPPCDAPSLFAMYVACVCSLRMFHLAAFHVLDSGIRPMRWRMLLAAVRFHYSACNVTEYAVILQSFLQLNTYAITATFSGAFGCVGFYRKMPFSKFSDSRAGIYKAAGGEIPCRRKAASHVGQGVVGPDW
jgi:hypothetical protein